MRTTRIPARPADWSTHRPADGQLVEVWTFHRSRRSRDRLVDGTTVYGTIAAVEGCIVAVSPAAYKTPAAALFAVTRLFAPPAPPAEVSP